MIVPINDHILFHPKILNKKYYDAAKMPKQNLFSAAPNTRLIALKTQRIDNIKFIVKL